MKLYEERAEPDLVRGDSLATREINLPWEALADLVRGHAHALRNDLSIVEMEIALLEASPSNSSESIASIRRTLQSSLAKIDRLAKLTQIPSLNPLPIRVAELVELWQLRLPAEISLVTLIEPGLNDTILECDVALLPEALAALGPEVGPFTATFRLQGNQLLIEFPARLVRAPSEALAERVSGALEEIETARARNIIFRHTGFGRQLESSGVPMWQVDLPLGRR
ncbi:MAG: hypothetical protein JO331_03235 [Verrucomicrobia bacterium]|nr:hypothetical protein [Verrucomicrobiota bacterium]